jgi:probable phosphoglycerate mutase
MRVVALRHGETDWNRNGRMQGHAPVPLNERGREQADRVGRYLAERYEFDRMVASDLERTRETAALVAGHVDVPITHDAAWRERGLGVYQGLTYEDVRERFPEFSLTEAALDALDHVPEGGESLVQVRDRVVEGWESLLAAGDTEETVLVVTHGGPIYVLLGHVKGMDLRTTFLEHSQANCAVNELHHDGTTRVCRENVTEWDDGASLEGAFGGGD